MFAVKGLGNEVVAGGKENLGGWRGVINTKIESVKVPLFGWKSTPCQSPAHSMLDKANLSKGKALKPCERERKNE
jgi:hypothetical protein